MMALFKLDYKKWKGSEKVKKSAERFGGSRNTQIIT